MVSETVIKRPFHWGIVIIVGDDWDGESEVPVFDPDRMVAANDFAVAIAVRHAQDAVRSRPETADRYVKFAEASVVARLLNSSPTHEGRREVFSGVIDVPSGRLSIGDADEETIVTAHRGSTGSLFLSMTRSRTTTCRLTSSTWTSCLSSTSGQSHTASSASRGSRRARRCLARACARIRAPSFDGN